jgi:putative membrane protein
MKISSLFYRTGLLLVLLAAAPSAFAVTEDSIVSWPPTSFGGALLATLVFGLVGIGLAILGFKMFDACIRFNLEKEICENKNVAAAILSAAIIAGICLIVAAAVHG